MSGRPCVESVSGTSDDNTDDSIRQLPPRSAPSASAGPSPIPACAPGMPALPEAALGHGTQHFDIRGWREDLGMPVAELGALFDEVYEHVTERAGLRLEGLIPVMLPPATAGFCPARGRAWHSRIELYVDSSWSREQWLGVLAHELGHVLQRRESPGIGRLGALFTEGYATWAAGRYWTDWQGQPSLHAAVRDFLERDVFLELSSPRGVGFGQDASESSDCIAQRDILYTERASLVEYLIERFGRESFYARAEAAQWRGTNDIDYTGIFDLSFDQIRTGWLEAVRAQR